MWHLMLVLLLASRPGSSASAAGAEPAAALPSAPAAAQPAATAADHGAVEEALRRASEALGRKDLAAALEAASEAVRLDPASSEARMRRVTVLVRLRGAGKSADDNRKIEDLLRGDLQAIIAAAPDSTAAGVARDTLAKLDSGASLEVAPVGCSGEGAAEVSAAEQLFAARRFEESLTHYERAAARCPDDPAVWVAYGDAYFALHDLPKARHLYETAIAKSPWSAQAHRFLADALGRQRLIAAAYHESVLAVLSDPTYEAAWEFLRSVILARHGAWTRVAAVKPKIKRDAASGKIEVGLGAHALDPSWMAYTLTRTQSQPHAAAARPPAGSAPVPAAAQLATPLARERDAVRAALSVRNPAAGSAATFWDMMARADEAGFLDEAIFLHLPDPDLLAEYPDHRAAHRDNLVKYVETVLAPLPP